MKRVAVLFAIAATLSLASTAHAEGDKSEWGLGFVPGIRVGKTWMAVEGPTGEKPGQAGWHLELDATGVLTFPGDRFAVGCAVGYVMGDLSRNDGTKTADLSYTGLTVTPTIMYAIVERVFLQGRFGWFDATWSPGDTEISKGALRYGGGVSAYVYRNYGADVLVQLDVLQTSAKDVDFGTYKGRIEGTTAMLGVAFTFMPNAFTF